MKIKELSTQIKMSNELKEKLNRYYMFKSAHIEHGLTPQAYAIYIFLKIEIEELANNLHIKIDL